MTQPPCHRDEHATHDEALECVRRRHRERMASRDPDQWAADCRRLIETHDVLRTLPAAEPSAPEPFPDEWQERFVETLATTPEFRQAVAAWTAKGAAA
jgi:hypothetical protein